MRVNKKMAVLLAAALTLSTVGSYRAVAKESTNLSTFKKLEANKSYYYDLDGDKKKEKIEYKEKVISEEDAITKITILVNGKSVLSKKLQCFYYNMYVGDLNTKDAYKDIYLSSGGASDVVMSAYFIRYQEGKFKTLKTMKRNEASKYLNLVRYSIGPVKSNNNTFMFQVDTPINVPAIGCYCCYVPYSIKGEKINAVKTNSYFMTKATKDYKFKVKKSFSMSQFVNANGKKMYTFKKGEKVYVDKLYVTSKGKCFVRLVNSKGVKGWINGSKEGLFVEIPSWG